MPESIEKVKREVWCVAAYVEIKNNERRFNQKGVELFGQYRD